MIMLTKHESIKTVKLFLQIYYYDETSSKDILGIINDLSNWEKTDPPLTIWGKYLNTAKTKLIEDGQFPFADTDGDKIISEEQAFESMILLLADYYEQTNSDDIGSFLSELLHASYGETSDPAAWYDWEKCLQKVVSERQ